MKNIVKWWKETNYSSQDWWIPGWGHIQKVIDAVVYLFGKEN